MARAPLLIALLVGCGDAPIEAPAARFEARPEAFFDAPWPADARRDDAGRPDWSAFPNPTNNPLWATFLAQASDRGGFGASTPVHLPLDAALDPAHLPSAEASRGPDSPLLLVDVDPRSPDFGARIPVVWEWREEAGAYLPGHLLTVAPAPGFPLRPGTTHALLVTTELLAPSEGFRRAWEAEGGPWREGFDLLQGALPHLGLHPDELAVATVFTTDDPLQAMDRVVSFLRDRVDPPTFTPELELLDEAGPYTVWRSAYTSPRLQAGDKPYAQAGGQFVFRDDGAPEVQGWDRMRLSVVTPPDVSDPPEGGWPVLVYLHGTGGDYRTFCNSTSAFEVGLWAAEAGVVGIGIDLPLHGTRGTPDTLTDLHSFNVVQPDSALWIHRQAAADLVYLLEGLAQGPAFTLPGGGSLPLDGDRMVVVGHSQGGITGALAAPWLGDVVDGTVLSGAGGLLAVTAVERDDVTDFAEIIRSLLSFEEGEELTELHPVLNVIQTLVEPTDPLLYAPCWIHADCGLTDAAPAPLLLTSGLRDEATPSRTAEALASAARLPFAGPRHARALAMTLRSYEGTSLPLSNHVEAWDGSRLTAGFAQYFDGDHFVIFRDPDARDLVRHFVLTALDGDAELDVVPAPEEE